MSLCQVILTSNASGEFTSSTVTQEADSCLLACKQHSTGRQRIITLLIQACVKISAPLLVIKIECSNCAAGLPSSVRVVQLSAQVTHSMLPSVRIGSAAYWLQCETIIHIKSHMSF